MELGDESYDIPYPSWSWLSTDTHVSFIDPCGRSILPEVIWHDPLRRGNTNDVSASSLKSMISLTNSTRCAGDQPLSANWLAGVDFIDFGLLQFTARTALLNVRRVQNSSSENSKGPETDEDDADGNDRDRDEAHGLQGPRPEAATLATVYVDDGDAIASLLSPLRFFGNQKQKLGEFVLLSSNAEYVSDESCKQVVGGLDCGSIRHIDGCDHIQSHNIMLVERAQGVAYRVGLCTVTSEAWQGVQTEEKKIVLG